jgi:hypothetical protein
MHKTHPLAWRAEPTDFATTHCSQCQAGWTRTGVDGAKIIVCLLDREPVLATMTDCDRFEPKEEGPPLYPLTPKRPDP